MSSARSTRVPARAGAPTLPGAIRHCRPLPPRGTHSVPNLERLGLVTVDRHRDLRLTANGRIVRDAFQPLCEQVESRWRHRFGSSLIDEVIAAVHEDGAWRPFPLVAWTGAEFSLLGDGS